MPAIGTLIVFVCVMGLIGLGVAAAIGLGIAIILAAPLGLIAWLFKKGNPLDTQSKWGLLVLAELCIAAEAAYLNPLAGVSTAIGLAVTTGVWWTAHPWHEGARRYEALALKFAGMRRFSTQDFAVYAAGCWTSWPTSSYAQARMRTLAAAMYREDFREVMFPGAPVFDFRYDDEASARLLAEAERVLAYVANDRARAQSLVGALTEGLRACAQTIPEPEGAGFSVGLLDILTDSHRLQYCATMPFMTEERRALGVGTSLGMRRNTSIQPFIEAAPGKDLVAVGVTPLAKEIEAVWVDVLEAGLGASVWDDLQAIRIPYGLPEHLRVEHAVIVAATGAGKTQLLESLILADLDQDDPPGIVVIDSKNDMIQRIAHLSMFHPDHGRLRDRLIIIDHRDKPALNMFDVPEALVNGRINEVASVMRYFLGSLLGNELSNQMNVLFLPLLHLILRIPGATLHDLIDVVRDPTRYPDVIERLPRGARSFLTTQYADAAYRATKAGIITRLYEIINESTLDDMFSAPNNAVDFAGALNAGSAILVSTETSSLQHLSPIFGKYVIAQIMNAGLARASMPRAQRRTIHVYIDECYPYVDEKLAEMLTTIRSYGIGVTLAFQGTWQMGAYTRAIQGNTAIKLMSEVEDADARAFDSDMRTSPEFIMSQRKQPGRNPTYGNFACFTRGSGHAISLRVSFGTLDARPLMTPGEYGALRARNKAALAPRSLAARELPAVVTEAPKAKPPRKDGGQTDTDASPEW
jgi:hypothetical protein